MMFLSILFISLSIQSGVNGLPPSSTAATCDDYAKLVELSTLFYEAQRSGDLPEESMRVKWRKDSALNDRGNDGEDLTGGYYDAGDHVKFGFPMASAMTVLSWGGIVFRSGYEKAGQTKHLEEAVRWGTDYLMKAHVSDFVFYGQVGDAELDHDYWGRPEDMTMERPAFAITKSKPGSELAGESAAALAAASVLLRGTDSSYADKLLSHAVKLFQFADQYRGKYSDSIPQASYYESYGYNDELVWAAIWLYQATNDQSYLDYAIAGYEQYELVYDMEVLSWDSKTAGIKIMLARLTGDQQFIDDVKDMCYNFIHKTPRSPKGLAFFMQWGSLRYAANSAFVCLQALGIDIGGALKQEYLEYAKEQMEYFISSTGRSFVVGFGKNYPKYPHHSSSSCPDAPTPCDWDNFESPEPNFHVLEGALVGGPDRTDDQFNDARDDYIENEVTLDYNAGFQSLAAGLRTKVCP